MDLSFDVPLNSVSFGQVSVALLRECHKRDMKVLISLIDGPDLASQSVDTSFFEWLEGALKDYPSLHNKSIPAFKIWHLEQNSHRFISNNQCLMTFHELNSLTKLEKNIAKNNDKLAVTSRFTKDVLDEAGAQAHYVPLAFDSHNFKVLDKDYARDGKIVFNLSGKFEFRKHHAKILKAWAKKYGNDKKYALQCAVFNPFLDAQTNNGLVAEALNQTRYFNISFMPKMQTNDQYNDYLNSSNIMIGMSGGEGWGLPEFQSVALGKHAVILDAHGYKEWANKENSVLVDSTSQIDCIDGVFFKKGADTNQGQIFDWQEEDFLNACEEAVERVKANEVNEKGLELQEKFTYSKTLDGILDILKS